MLYRLTVEIDAFLDYDLTFEEEVRTTVVASADVHIKKLEYKHMMKAVEQLMKAFNARSRALSCELVTA